MQLETQAIEIEIYKELNVQKLQMKVFLFCLLPVANRGCLLHLKGQCF